MNDCLVIRVKGDARRVAACTEEAAWECAVTNDSESTLTVRLQVSAVTPAAAGSWFRLEGESIRELAPKRETNVRIVATTPAGTPAGDCSFRLLANAQEDPEAIVTESSPLTLRVTDGSPPRKLPRWIPFAAGAAALVAVIVILIVLLSGDDDIRFASIQVDPDWVAESPPAVLEFGLAGLEGDLLSADWVVDNVPVADQHGETMRHEFKEATRHMVTVTVRGTDGDPQTTTASVYVLEKPLVGLTLAQATEVIAASGAMLGDRHPSNAAMEHKVKSWKSRRPDLVDLWLEP